jgi:hypothetical protein
MSGVITAALRQIGKAEAAGQKVELYLGQVDLIETDKDKERPAVQAIVLTFANATQKEVQARFELMARDAGKQNKGQELLGAMPSIPPGQSFTNAFLDTIAAVDGQSFAAFNPQANPLHAALEYAHKNGGKGHTVTAAMEKLQKTLVNPKATAEQKETAKEMIGQLSQFSGAVSIYPPKLGAFFRRQPIQELFQAVLQSISSADIWPPRRRTAKAAGSSPWPLPSAPPWFLGSPQPYAAFPLRRSRYGPCRRFCGRIPRPHEAGSPVD